MAETKIPKKKGRPSAKETAVKKKVADLLDGIELTPKQKKDVVSKVSQIEQKSGGEWIESELDRVTEENEKLRKVLANIKANVPQVAQQPSNENEQKIRILFKEMEGILLGRNPKNAKFKNVETKYVLDRLLQLFPFLNKKKR